MAASALGALTFLVFVLFSFLQVFCNGVGKDVFSEELLIKPLRNGVVYNHFQFTTHWDMSIWDKTQWNHYNLFPKSLGEIVKAFSIQELHFSLTQGLWRHDKWGYAVNDAPPGAELWVWFEENTDDVNRQWLSLTNALSGQFCASLNFMDMSLTVQPQLAFRPQGVTPGGRMPNSSYVRYSALPHENLCTENLTPWKKLLPCIDKAGLSTLLNAVNLLDSSYHSLSISVRPVCRNVLSAGNCEETSVELGMSAAVVVDNYSRNKGRPDWSIRQLFGIGIQSACPLAVVSAVYVDLTNIKHEVTLSPPANNTVQRYGSQFAVYDVTSRSKGLNVAAKYTENQIVYQKLRPPVLSVTRFVSGQGQEFGGIVCLIHNAANTDTNVIYMESLPWYIRIYLHTLKIESNGVVINPDYRHYIPGKDRVRMNHFELAFTVPRLSTTKLTIDFEMAFLKWTEYPPDANHGFYINSAVVTALLRKPNSNETDWSQHQYLFNLLGSSLLQLHSETLLVSLPTPDFSMPYNVICLACTVVAIAFGSIHNLTTRRFVVLDPKKPRGIIGKVKNFLKYRKKKDGGKDKTDDS